jgi:hypothetical protein
MRKTLLGAVLVAFLAACTPSSTALPLDSIRLRAVHGLWGGMNVFLKADGSLWVQDVSREGDGFLERRFQGSLPASEVKELEALLGRHDFPSIRIPPRTGIPDETSVTLVARLKDGRAVTLSAFTQDVHEGFTPVHHWLRVRGERIDHARLVYQGAPDPAWKPPGF